MSQEEVEQQNKTEHNGGSNQLRGRVADDRPDRNVFLVEIERAPNRQTSTEISEADRNYRIIWSCRRGVHVSSIGNEIVEKNDRVLQCKHIKCKDPPMLF